MEYRRLGNTGLKVSEVSLGSWLSNKYAMGEERSIELARCAYENGINFFDTANVYGRGESEITMGKALSVYDRSSYVLATKVFGGMGDGPNDKGLSRKHIMEQANASLKRLNMDYVDIIYCHRHDDETPVEETLRAFDDLIHQGKVFYIGVSEWTAAQLEEAAYMADRSLLNRFVVNQPHYNMLHRDMEAEVLPVSERLGIGQVAFSPLAEGVLTGKYTSLGDIPANSRAASNTSGSLVRHPITEETLRISRELKSISDGLGMPMAQMALAWILRIKSMASVIIGASRIQQIEENVKASGCKLPQDAIDAIEKILS